MKDTVQQFADLHRLRIRRDSCGDAIIPGKRATTDLGGDRPEYRNHIFDFGDGRLGVCLLFGTRRAWTLARKKLLAAGLTLHQDADTEGVLLFDPESAQQARWAIKVTGARPKRVPSPAQIAALNRARTIRTARNMSKAA